MSRFFITMALILFSRALNSMEHPTNVSDSLTITVPPEDDLLYPAIKKLFESSVTLKDSYGSTENQFAPGLKINLGVITQKSLSSLLYIEYKFLNDKGNKNLLMHYFDRFSLERIADLFNAADYLCIKKLTTRLLRYFTIRASENKKFFKELQESSISKIYLDDIQSKSKIILKKQFHIYESANEGITASRCGEYEIVIYTYYRNIPSAKFFKASVKVMKSITNSTLALCNNGNLLAVTFNDINRATIFDISINTPKAIATLYDETILYVDLYSDQIATASTETICLWDRESENLIKKFNHPYRYAGPIVGINYISNGQELAITAGWPLFKSPNVYILNLKTRDVRKVRKEKN